MSFFWLIFGHFLADLPWQGEWIAKEKGKIALFMIGHCVIWAGTISLVLIALNLFSPWKCLFLFVSHYLTDIIKCKKTIDQARIKKLIEYGIITFSDAKKIRTKNKNLIYIDQLIHLVQLICVYFF